MHCRLIAIAALMIATQSTLPASQAEESTGANPPGVQMMGVSSAWNDEPSRNTQIKSAGSSPHDLSPVSKQLSGRLAQRSTGQAFFSEKSIEKQLDIWQKQIKEFCKSATPRLVAFSNWAAKKIGFARGSKAPVPDLKMAESPPPRTIKVHLQQVSGAHAAWLMRDGRLKTVAAK